MNTELSSRVLRVGILSAVAVVWVSNAGAFSILGHRVIALRVLHAVRQRPEAYPPFLRKIAQDDTLKKYFLAGTDAPDLGALMDHPRPSIQYSTHYEHPGLWIKTLFAHAHDDNDRAFAWGWVVHEGADLQVHPWMEEKGLNYCDDWVKHVVFEVGMDCRVGATYADYFDEGVHAEALQATRLLHEARLVVQSATTHSPEYDRYLGALHERCKKSDTPEDEGDTNKIIALTEFVLVKEAELGIGAIVNGAQDKEQYLLHDAADAPWMQRAWASMWATAIEAAKELVRNPPRMADNAEMVSLYGFAPGNIQRMLRAAEAHDWNALDLNFDTAKPVHDPSLAENGIDVALVLDASGSMRENDPDDLRKRAAEMLIDRSPDAARFTVVRFNQDASVLTTHSGDRDELRRAISTVGADGGTHLCKATYAALDALAAEATKDKAIILLTDGLSQDNCDPADIARRGIRVFTIGLSPAANGALLQGISASTDASYVHARTAADVQSVFDMMIAQVLHQSSVADFTATALPGATSRFRLPVDTTITALTVLLTWPGSSLDLTLLSPSGKHLTASLEGRTAATYEMLRVDAPESGIWTAAVKSVDVAPAGEPFRLRATADTPVHLKLEPLETEGSPAMRATLETSASITLKFDARVERPDGKIDDADLEQDGRSFVARYTRADIPGAYNFIWSALGGTVSRVATRSVFIGETAIQGGTVQSIEGQYVRWNRGSLHGIRHGLPVRIMRQGQEIGRGRAIDVRPAESDIEIDSVSGVAEVNVGDEVQVEMGSWAADAVQP